MLSNALNGEDFITMQKMQLTYYNLNLPTTSALGYYMGSMQAITKGMKQNLGKLETEDIKTFTYDYSEDYEQSSEIIGKGIYSGGKSYDSISSNSSSTENKKEEKKEDKEEEKESTEPMEDLTGKTVSYAREVAKKYDLSFVVADEEGNTISNPDSTAKVTDQSIRAGNKVEGYVTLKVYIKVEKKEESSSSTNTNTNTSDKTPTTPTSPTTPTTPTTSDTTDTTPTTPTTPSTDNTNSSDDNN
jgi:hypothetical protein